MHDLCLAGWASLHHEWQALVVDGRSLGMMLVLSVVLSPLLAPVFLWAYRRRVIRYMNLQQPVPQGVIQPQAPVAAAPAPHGSLGALSPFVAARYRRVRLATWTAYAVFCVGALVLAVFTAPDRGGGGLWQLPLATAFLALGPALVNLRPQASPQVRAAFVLGALGIAIIVAADPVYWGNSTGDYLINNTADTVLGALMTFALCAMCMHRKVRTQLLPTALVLWWGCLTCVVVTATVEANSCTTPLAAEGGWRIPGLVAVYVTIWLMLRLATGSLSLLGWLFQGGWISDLSISALTGIAMIATVLCLQVLTGSNALVGVALAWTAACVLGYAVALRLSKKADGPAPRLLVLRVFNSGAVAELVLDDVQQRWRLAGPVLQIGGPDLAGINVDLFEFSRLLGGRLHEIFLLTVPGLDELQRRLDVDHDAEGRFRVTEVFCIGTAWAGTVAHLIEMADAILLDLRGFASERQGTLREVEMLAARAAFSRVVMLADERTDLVLARRLFKATPASGRINEPAQVVTLASKGHDSAAPHRIWDALLAVSEGRPLASAP